VLQAPLERAPPWTAFRLLPALADVYSGRTQRAAVADTRRLPGAFLQCGPGIQRPRACWRPLQPLTVFCSCGGRRYVVLSVLCVCQALSLAYRRALLEKLNLPPGRHGPALRHAWKTYLQAIFPVDQVIQWPRLVGRAVFMGLG
jgi:hypothetical protein